MAFIGNSPTQGVITGGNIVDGSIESIDLATLTNIDINSGSIDGTVIGGSTPAAGSFSTLGTTGAATFSGDVGIAGQASPTYKLDGGFADQTWGWYLNSSYNAGFTFNTAERSLLIHTKSAENIDHIKFATSSTGAERMRIDSSGNVGLGVVPSAWGTTVVGLDVGSAGSFWGTKSGNTLVAMSDNSYFNGSSYIARNAGVGSKYYQNAGSHYWETAASASAGAVQSNTTLMTLDASGNFSVARTGYISSSTNGFYANNEGWTHTSVSGEPTAYFNRNTSDGDIAVFQRQGTRVGSIGSYLGSGESQLYVAGADTGFKFNSTVDVIAPSDGSGGTRDAAIDLGDSGGRFKDLYLSGTANLNFINHSETIYPTTDAAVDIGTSSERYRNLYLSGTVNAGAASFSNASGGNVAQFTNTTSADLNINLTSGVTLLTPSTGVLAFGTSATERMRLDANGRLNINGASFSQGTLLVKQKFDGPYGGLVVESLSNDHFLGLSHDSVSDCFVLSPTYNTTGAYKPFAIHTSNIERLRVDTSGNLGIGRTDPTQLLEVHKNSGGDQTVAKFSAHNYSDTGKTYIELGTEYEDGSSRIGSFNDTGNKSVLVFETHGASSGAFDERMRIDSIGNLLVAKTTAGTVLTHGVELSSAGGVFSTTSDAGNSSYFVNLAATGTRYLQRFYASTTFVGSITSTGTATAYNTTSDYRLKEDVVPMTGATERVKALRPINFAWKVDGSRTDGFFAHEAQEVVPECSTGSKDAMRDEEYEVTPAVEEVRDEDGNITTEAVAAVMGTRSVPDYQGIDQSKLVPLLTATIQELIARIEALENK